MTCIFMAVQSHTNSGLSRAIARLKGDRSPFNTSSSDLPEIAGDFRAANLQSSFFLYAPRLSLRSVAGILPLWGSASRTACVLPFGLRLQAQSASRTLSVDRLPAAKIAPPATRLNLRFNQVGLRSRLRNLWFRTLRRTRRWKRLNIRGALPLRYLPAS